MRWAAAWGLVFLFGCRQAGAPGGTGNVPPRDPPSVEDPGDAGTGQPTADAGPDAGIDAGPGGTGQPDAGPPDAGPPPAGPRWPPPRTGYVNPIPGENARTGDPDWHSHFTNAWAKQIEAYADRVSASPGESVKLMVRSDAVKNASWTLYRLGWYGGAGARGLVSGTVAVAPQAPCANEVATGLVHCSWTPTFSVTIPRDAVSGLFLVRIVREDRIGVLIPVVVKDQRPADLYFQSSVTTAQAYNNWGGEGLYSDSDDHVPGGFAIAVSFDRPYDSDFGSGQVQKYEALMARWLERHGYDVSYTTNLDVAREGTAALVKRGAFLSVGHDEYWPGEERDAVQAARDMGVPLYFFGGNAAYWKVRLSNPGVDGNARIVTCYKKRPQDDPFYGKPQQTGRFRDAPISRPEEALVGAMYESWMLFGMPWTVFNAAHPMYQGTGLHDFDTIPQLVGYEYDRTFEGGAPGKVTTVSRSPLIDAEGKPGLSEATIYTAPSGAFVFDAATIYWAHGLDGPLRDARVERMTANLLWLGMKLPVPDALKTVTGPASPRPDADWATDVSTIAAGMPGPSGVAQLPDGTFVVADSRAQRIWRVDGTGRISPFAGDGNPDGNPRYDNVPALEARFFQPTALVADAAGNVYVSDSYNCAIRRIANDADRTVSTVAGVLKSCTYADGVGPAARLQNPMGMAWIDATHLAIADMNNHAIRSLDVVSGAVTTLAVTHYGDDLDGPASVANFYYPTAVAAAPDGRIFFVASSLGELKVIGTDPAHTVTTLAGGTLGYADGPGTTAMMQPQGGLVWMDGTLVISDSGSQRLRLITPASNAASTRVQTWAGNGLMGADDGSARTASFQVPMGLTRGANGVVYLVDGAAGTLRAVRP